MTQKGMTQEVKDELRALAAMAMQGAMANPAFATASPQGIAAMCIEQATALVDGLEDVFANAEASEEAEG